MAFGGLSRDAGFSLVLTTELFNWFLSTEEGLAWVEDYTTELLWTDFCGKKSNAPTHFGEWFFGVSVPKRRGEETFYGERTQVVQHPIWEAARKAAKGASFGDHLLRGFQVSFSSESPFYVAVGEAIKYSNWWKTNKRAFRKQIKDLEKVSEVQTS